MNNNDKKLILKNWMSFIKCMRSIYSVQVDDAHDIDLVKPMYNLRKYSNSYFKKS